MTTSFSIITLITLKTNHPYHIVVNLNNKIYVMLEAYYTFWQRLHK